MRCSTSGLCSKQTLSLSLLLYLGFFVNYNATVDPNVEPRIDIDHFTEYPRCGENILETELRKAPSSRIANSDESKHHYPWVCYVERHNKAITSGYSTCGGTIITKRFNLYYNITGFCYTCQAFFLFFFLAISALLIILSL